MFSNLSRRRVAVLLVLTCLLLLTLDRRGSAVIDRARSGFDAVLRPFDTAAEAISRPIANAWYGITNYDDLEEENARLRDEIDSQRGTVIEARAAILEFYELLKVNRLTSAGNYPTVVARIIGSAASNTDSVVTINKGRSDGLVVGMPVSNGAGLIGRITRVNEDTALVRLITDPQFAVAAEVLQADDDLTPGSTTTTTTGDEPASDTTLDTTTTVDPATVEPTTPPVTDPPVINLPTTTPVTSGSTPTETDPGTGQAVTTTTIPDVEVVREAGTLEGQGAGKPLLLTLVDESANLREGAVVKTAGGIDDLFPQGIPIGVISKVIHQTGTRSLIVEVTPNARLLRQRSFVAVVLYVPNQKAS